MIPDVEKLINSLRHARMMEYVPGTYGSNLHEETMEDIFMNNGLNRVEAPYYSLDIEDLGGFLVSGEYMSQPCGSYHSPDFIVRIGDTIFPIELKSSKKYTPKFGSTPPGENTIYVFTSEIRGTSIVLGSTIAPPGQAEMCYEIDQKIRYQHKALLEEYNLTNMNSTIRVCWEARFDWFTDVQKYFDDVVNFVYSCSSLQMLT